MLMNGAKMGWFLSFLISGHVKPSNRKDCILIIDQETGEVTLERLSGHIMVKKTRKERPETGEKADEVPVEKLERPEKAAKSSYIGNGGSSRPLTPIEPFQKSNKASSPGTKGNERRKNALCT